MQKTKKKHLSDQGLPLKPQKIKIQEKRNKMELKK